MDSKWQDTCNISCLNLNKTLGTGIFRKVLEEKRKPLLSLFCKTKQKSLFLHIFLKVHLKLHQTKVMGSNYLAVLWNKGGSITTRGALNNGLSLSKLNRKAGGGWKGESLDGAHVKLPGKQWCSGRKWVDFFKLHIHVSKMSMFSP